MEIDRIINLAKDNYGRSVIKINPNIYEELIHKEKDLLTFGVKNTKDISKEYINRLRNNKKYLWVTIDRMSHLGRSIDTELVNPLTYRAMTGSSSGTAINVFKGINDVGIGTDGGGSILAPALSLNLYSVIGSGIELNVDKTSLSTDKISFVPSIGLISRKFKVLMESFESISKTKIEIERNRKIKVVIPIEDNWVLPDGEKASSIIKVMLTKISKEIDLEVIDYEFKDLKSRAENIKDINNIFNNNIGDVILNFEGPIDVLGYDETIQRSFDGKTEQAITNNGGKGLIKAANICKCTGITIPSSKLASGFVIIGKEGMQGMNDAFNIANSIEKYTKLPQIIENYFINKVKYIEPLDF